MGTSLANAANYTDFTRFAALRTKARNNTDEVVGAVAKEFEALFIQLMLKAARDASTDGGLFDSRELDLYREMMDGQVALAMAERGELGFEDLLRGQLQAPAVLSSTGRDLEFPTIVPPIPSASAHPPAGSAELDPARTKAPSAQRLADPFDEVFPHEDLAFIDSLRPYAESTAQRLGTSPNMLIAQAVLETGWGRHVIRHPDGRSANNYFGIKADPSWGGSVARVTTLEYFGDQPVRVRAAFRSYDGVEQGFSDYADFLEQNPRYRQALLKGSDGSAFITELARAGYATDPAYAHKVRSIAEQIDGLTVSTATSSD